MTLYRSHADRKNKVLRYAAVLSVLMAGYFMFINVIPDIYMKVTGETGLVVNMPPWHTIYVGYGFEENPYGIEYNDSCGMDFVASVDPDAAYLSAEYFDILRDEIFHMWRSDPVYFVGSYFRKIAICFKMAVFWDIYSVVIGVAGSIYIICKKGRKELSAVAAASLLSFLINMIFPLMAVPFYEYMLGMLCSLNFYSLWVMACAIAIFLKGSKSVRDWKRHGGRSEEKQRNS